MTAVEVGQVWVRPKHLNPRVHGAYRVVREVTKVGDDQRRYLLELDQSRPNGRGALPQVIAKTGVLRSRWHLEVAL